MFKKFFIIIILPLFISGCILTGPVDNEPVVDSCDSYSPESCPASCVVCPPCLACSSISCQTEEFCKDMGIDRSWYEEIKKQISNFNDCIDAGNPAMESYPRKCRTSDDRTFVEYIGNELEKTDLIRIDFPRPNQKISSPLNLSGQARGTWFFEGDFPIKLINEAGQLIAQGYATAQDESMTEDFVDFKAELEFDQTNSKYGQLLLIKDNPSDLPENDDQLIVPVEF